jgi:ferrochelatase
MILDEVDALLIESFGAPESPEGVLPFLERVTAGRGIPNQRLAAVAEQYRQLGGVSPLNQANRDLAARLRPEVPDSWPGEKVYLGNRNSEPFLPGTLSLMAEAGIRRAAVFVTSAFSSYSGCRQYRENLAVGLEESQAAIELTVMPRFHDQPLLAEIWADRIAEVWPGRGTHLVFATHSLPVAGSEMYVSQHLDLATRIVDRLNQNEPPSSWELAYQSRSGSPKQPWLEPDISDAIRACVGRSVSEVLVAPIGFLAPNLEIAWDLDKVAQKTARDLGIGYVRAETPQSDPRFSEMILKMLSVEQVLRCPIDCCPNPRGIRPAVR